MNLLTFIYLRRQELIQERRGAYGTGVAVWRLGLKKNLLYFRCRVSFPIGSELDLAQTTNGIGITTLTLHASLSLLVFETDIGVEIRYLYMNDSSLSLVRLAVVSLALPACPHKILQ